MIGWCMSRFLLFFFKQKTAYEMRISDWSSDVCSSDLHEARLKLLKTRELTGDQILTRGRTSRRAARLEIALSTHISLSLGDGVPLALPEQVDTSLRGSILNDDQRKVLAEIALSSDRVMGVHGVAGSEIGRAHV